MIILIIHFKYMVKQEFNNILDCVLVATTQNVYYLFVSHTE